MYRLSKDVDLGFLVGVELHQVCVGKNEVILNFDHDVRITILSDFAVGNRDAPFTKYHDASTGAIALLPLLHCTVSHAKATDEGGLLLTFGSGVRLEVFDDSDQYESFWIAHGEQQIII